MDAAEIERRQREAVQKHKEIGTHEYRKMKAEKRRKYYEEHEKPIREAINAGAELTVLDEKPVLLKPQKKRGCSVQVLIVDETSETTLIWDAPALMGTVMGSKRNAKGYAEILKPLLQNVFGKLKDQ